MAKRAIRARPDFINSMVISHFGANPVRGGKPPIDRSMRGSVIVRAGILAQEIDKELMCLARIIIREKNNEEEISRYV